MQIIVYGLGCPTCHATEKVLREAAQALEPDATVVLETRLEAIAAAGIMAMPGVAIDGVVVSTGHQPSQVEARVWIAEAQARK